MYQDFTSLPPEQEREFVVFEQKMRESSKSAANIGMIVAGIFAVLVIAVVMSYDKPEALIKAEDINVTETRSAPSATPAPAPTPAPTPTPAAAPAVDPAAAPATGAEGQPAGAAADPAAPPPPAGATKAPPTALVKPN